MSNWTHVSAICRIDDIRLSDIIPSFDQLIGRECLFDSPRTLWREMADAPEEFLPCGSEGTLHKSVWINPHKSDMAAYTVSIFGDLRDHDDPQAVVDWFKELCSDLPVRGAVIEAVNDLNGSVTWSIDQEVNHA